MPILEPQDRLYPLEPWRLTEQRFDAASNLLAETLFALGNGSIGLRGAHEEGLGWPAGSSLDGTYLNGFYETEALHYPETAYGLARQTQFMLNVPNGKRIELFVEGERFDLLQGTIVAYERFVDFRTGILSRSVEWISPRGHRIGVDSRRLVSFDHRHLFAIEYRVRLLNCSGRIALVSALEGGVRNLEAGDDPRAGTAVSGPALQLREVEQTEEFSALVHRTRHSGLTLVSAIAGELVCEGGREVGRTSGRVEERVEQRYEVEVAEGGSVCLTKYGAYLSSRDYPEAALLPRAREVLLAARSMGFEALRTAQERFLSAFWQQADVEIAGDEALQQGMHFNQFHLLQSVGRDGKTSISAKGVTGEGYEGHYFWDTEIYNFPFFLFTKPEIARRLLDFRYQGLEQARERARQMSHPKGALYPWRTIAGEECSAYFPAGTAQYHINADIVYSIKLYAEVTGDESFLFPRGAEIVMETARIWMGIGGYVARKGGCFCINEVTGPDEYSALVNNNYYTNAMAQMHLRYAWEVAEALRTRFPEEFARLERELALEPGEPARWREAAERMYLPVDEELGIHPQDDSFLSRQVWDFAGTPKDHHPLLLHYHPLVIYRYQVCKQADVVLALLLLSDRFTPEEKRRDFDYYEAVTTHDSSLSSCVFSIIASELGYREKAYAYFMETARMDLDNSHANTQYGVHTAAMAGSWLGVVQGFAGMRVVGGSLHFAPLLPDGWEYYRFTLRVRDRLLQVRVDREQAEYRLLQGEALTLTHEGRTIQLTPEMQVRTAPLGEQRYAAVIFDLDGVITDTAHYHFLAWKRLADRLGIPFDETFNERLKGVDRMGSLELILARSGRQFGDAEKWALAEQKNRDYQQLVATMTPADLLPGAVEALRSVRKAGLKVGLASVSKNAPAVLERLGITGWFDYVVDAQQVTKGKPDPEIFLTAAAHLGVPPAACIGVEDAIAGVRAIKAAGMYALGIGDPAVLHEADRVIPGLAAFVLEDSGIAGC